MDTIDVSRPRPSTWSATVAGAMGDLAFAILLALVLPIALIVIGAPVTLLVRAILEIVP